MPLTEINLLDLDVFARGGFPHDWFTHLRGTEPVHRHPEPDGPGFWVISKHEDIRAIGRDAATYSSDQSLGGVAPIDGPEGVTRPAPFKPLLMMDPPEHTRYRKLVSRGFTARVVKALEPRIRERAAQILDAAIAKGTCDFVVDVAAELPQLVIADLLGIPPEDRRAVFAWMSQMTGSDDPEFAQPDGGTIRAQAGLFQYAGELAARRRAAPGRDIVSELVRADIDGDELTDMELNAFFILLAAAGNETTRTAIAHGMHAFLQNPDEFEKLVAQPDTMIGTATEEILRWSSPVTYFRRNLTRDVQLRGQQLKAGQKVSLWYPSANRDEDVFDDPFRFDIERTPNDHLAFGGGGPHFCLGAALARVEIRVLFEELAARVPAVEATGTPEYLRSNLVNGIKHLPVRLHRARA